MKNNETKHATLRVFFFRYGFSSFLFLHAEEIIDLPQVNLMNFTMRVRIC